MVKTKEPKKNTCNKWRNFGKKNERTDDERHGMETLISRIRDKKSDAGKDQSCSG